MVESVKKVPGTARKPAVLEMTMQGGGIET